jgi:hypothetical protein
VELMLSANTLTISYVEALLAATPSELLVAGSQPKKLNGASAESLARLQREMAQVQNQYKLAEQTYGQDVLHLVLARGYLQKLLENPQITRFLRQQQPEILSEFESIVQTVSLEG